MDPLPFTLETDGSIQVSVDLRLYGESALLKAAHRFTDRCHLHLLAQDEHTVIACLRHKQADEGDPIAMAGEFANELLDQRLRALVQRESEPVRNLILAHALSRTSLVGVEEQGESTTKRENAATETSAPLATVQAAAASAEGSPPW